MSGQFHEISFPFALAVGAVGGPQRRTEIVSLVSGREERNAPWAHSRRRWNAAPGIKTKDDLETLLAFFEARRGQLYGFRFRDPLDHASGELISPTDQEIGVGDGVADRFQLVKRYADSAGAYARPISKPVDGSVRLAFDGVEQPDTAFSVDHSTGEIALPTPPAIGVVISAGYEFEVPVRFDTDRLDISLEAIGAGDVTELPVIEIRV